MIMEIERKFLPADDSWRALTTAPGATAARYRQGYLAVDAGRTVRVRLSDILPNYILKEQTDIGCTLEVGNRMCSVDFHPSSTCPGNYGVGLVVIPTMIGTNIVKATTNNDGAHTHTHNLGISGSDITGGITQSGAHTHGLERCPFLIALDSYDLPYEGKTSPAPGVFGANTYRIQLGYDCNADTEEFISAIVQFYCVYRPAIYTREADCTSAGFTWSGGKCTATLAIPVENTQTACESAGFTWVGASGNTPAHCKYEYTVAKINAIADTTQKLAACKAAGFKWDGSVCSSSSP